MRARSDLETDPSEVRKFLLNHAVEMIDAVGPTLKLPSGSLTASICVSCALMSYGRRLFDASPSANQEEQRQDGANHHDRPADTVDLAHEPGVVVEAALFPPAPALGGRKDLRDDRRRQSHRCTSAQSGKVQLRCGGSPGDGLRHRSWTCDRLTAGGAYHGPPCEGRKTGGRRKLVAGSGKTRNSDSVSLCVLRECPAGRADVPAQPR